MTASPNVSISNPQETPQPQARFDTLTVCLSPAADKNKVLLARGREVWLYDPKAAKPVAIEPRRLRGKFWEIDLLAACLAEEYDAELLPDDYRRG